MVWCFERISDYPEHSIIIIIIIIIFIDLKIQTKDYHQYRT
jgi:hypothetical protein